MAKKVLFQGTQPGDDGQRPKFSVTQVGKVVTATYQTGEFHFEGEGASIEEAANALLSCIHDRISVKVYEQNHKASYEWFLGQLTKKGLLA